MLKISFNFDEISQQVSNVKVEHTSGSKTRGVVATKNPNEVESIGPDVEVLDNKLQLSKAALLKLDAKADDRISIQYISEGIGKSSPIIGKAEAFTDRRDGNRLTAKGTVAFRGEKHDTLVDFGTIFTMEPYKEGVFKLVSYAPDTTSNDDLEQEETDAENLNDSEIDNEIENLMQENIDDLPF